MQHSKKSPTTTHQTTETNQASETDPSVQDWANFYKLQEIAEILKNNEGSATTALKKIEQVINPSGDVWEPTADTKPIDPRNPDVKPALPASDGQWNYKWVNELMPKIDQHKPGLPNIGLGPFDAPRRHWRMYRQEK
ncbi:MULTISPECIES: hypothetical protein [unclassified Thalassospira]|uniref:hypothetical protein n=1 Tax=unclassified Thalassospira TaxID=2648997 RepID=UPI0007A6111E|nr:MULTISPECIES: hypothetical protein [unclassified Thalassospira]KZD01138.1 hypothetical protein AUQ41_20355 [Thalassospira sp. MCCC 1A02898]ONH85291.1 hypothetical protein TH47_06230 [Thalassospira sp. MCCC 1A02803]